MSRSRRARVRAVARADRRALPLSTSRRPPLSPLLLPPPSPRVSPQAVSSMDACGGCLRRQEVPNARKGRVREHGFSTRIRPCLTPRSAGSRGQVSAKSRGISPAKVRPSSGPIAKSPPRKLRALADHPPGRIARPHRLQARASESIQSKNDDFDQLTIALDDCRSLPAPRR